MAEHEPPLFAPDKKRVVPPAPFCSRCGGVTEEIVGAPFADRWLCPKDQVLHFQDGRPGQG